MLYRPSKVPLPPDISIPEPTKPAGRQIPPTRTIPTSEPSSPVFDRPSRPTTEALENARLKQQNEDLRDLLNKTNMVIIEARVALKQLTSDLVVNNKAQIKQDILDLNKILNHG